MVREMNLARRNNYAVGRILKSAQAKPTSLSSDFFSNEPIKYGQSCWVVSEKGHTKHSTWSWNENWT